ncbi:MAG: CBS domain-containing protein [Candidatus Desantisbacteria bacterium]
MKEELLKAQELVYELKVRDVMVKDVFTISPKETMADLRMLLKEKQISGIPVVEKGKMIGVVSIEDLINCLITGQTNALIEEKMQRDIMTLYEDEPLTQAMNKFNKHNFGRLPVIDRKNNLVGIVTKGTIVSGLLKRLDIKYQEEELRRFRASHIFHEIITEQATLLLEYNIIGQDFNRAGEAGSKLKRELEHLGILPEVRRRVGIATYEAEINIVVFTPGGKITALIKPHQIEVRAKDTGPGIPDIRKAMQPGFSTAPEWVRELGFGAGMGLVNIKKCSDKMAIRSKVGKGTNLKFIVGINEDKRDS